LSVDADVCRKTVVCSSPHLRTGSCEALYATGVTYLRIYLLTYD